MIVTHHETHLQRTRLRRISITLHSHSSFSQGYNVIQLYLILPQHLIVDYISGTFKKTIA